MLRNYFLNTKKKIFKWNHYFEIYDHLFENYRNKKIKILEIGILDGGSLEMWKNYFGPYCEVIGVDIQKECKKYENIKNNIRVYIGDASNKKFVKKILSKEKYFDIVIDDGAHTNYTVLNSFKHLVQKTKKLYIVEDTHSLIFMKSFHSFIRDLKSSVQHHGLKLGCKLKRVYKIIKLFLFRNYSFYDFSKKISSDITSDRHGLFVIRQRFNNNKKIAITAEGNISKNIMNIHSVSFYDSMIVFQIRQNYKNKKHFAERNF